MDDVRGRRWLLYPGQSQDVKSRGILPGVTVARECLGYLSENLFQGGGKKAER
jgi:hypothetical protein